MHKTQLVISALLLVLLLTACAPAAPARGPQTPAPISAAAPAPAAPVPVQRPGLPWEETWAKTLAAAKKEGRLVIPTSGGIEFGNALVTGMRDAYGIPVEALSQKGALLLPRLSAERRAGLYLYDIYLGGITTPLLEIKPAGMLQPLEPALILPDVTEPERIKKVWWKGQLPWADRDRTVFDCTITPRTPVAINTNLVNPDEIKSWHDLLNPKWKGKMTIHDPSVAGSGQTGLTAVDGLVGEGFIRELAKMEPIVMRDERLTLEWLAHGKISVVVFPKPDLLPQFLRIGTPIKGIVPKEGTHLSASSTGMSLFNKEPHPNAARVFINWMTSYEGQAFFAPAIGFQSSREDVRTDYLQPEEIRREGMKYFRSDTEGPHVSPRRVEVTKLATQLFPVMR